MKSCDKTEKFRNLASKRYGRRYLSRLYQRLGMSELKKNNIDSGCFFLTNAYVFALEEGLVSEKKIHEVLKKYGREH